MPVYITERKGGNSSPCLKVTAVTDSGRSPLGTRSVGTAVGRGFLAANY